MSDARLEVTEEVWRDGLSLIGATLHATEPLPPAVVDVIRGLLSDEGADQLSRFVSLAAALAHQCNALLRSIEAMSGLTAAQVMPRLAAIPWESTVAGG